MRIFGDIQSGNCYKVKLLLSLLDIPHEWVNVDILAGETSKPDFLKMNPNSKIPVLELDDNQYLSESNAILNYLANGTAYLPEDNYLRAKTLQWMFFEQYSHEPYIAVARYISKYLGLPENRRADYESKQVGGHKALRVMETQLTKTKYLVGETPTIADVCLYGYTHVASEGGFELEQYPCIQTWLQQIQLLPNYKGMQ